MANDLTVLQDLPITVSKYATPQALATLTSSSFLPRIQVMGGNNDIVKEGKFPIGHYALVSGQNLDDLGDQFIGIVLAWRPKAMQFQPEVVAYYDPDNEGFKSVKNRADNEPQSGCGYGPEFLLWLPDKEKFASFFCSNITARQEAPNILTFMRKACLFQIILIKSKKYTWHGPRVNKCDMEVQLPATDILTEAINTFNNPPSTEVEIVDTKDERER